MEHGQSGKQDDGWNPEMDISEDRCPHTGGFRRGVFFSHKFASMLIAKWMQSEMRERVVASPSYHRLGGLEESQ
jgi:hypothetical protein